MDGRKYDDNFLGIQCKNQNESWIKDSPEECGSLCENIEGCDKFTWIEKDNIWDGGENRCCLKNMTGKVNVSTTETSGRISGPIYCSKFHI